MGKEIERKFLVNNPDYRKNANRTFIHQGFLSTDKERVVRVRVRESEATITIKGISKGAERSEFEYKIPLKDAEQLLSEICIQPTIKKYRYKVNHKGFVWEVDEFMESNEGLIIAEIEIPEINTVFDIPSWAGKEVTEDTRYYNSNLIKNPFKNWK